MKNPDPDHDPKLVKLSQIRPGPIRNESLPQDLLDQIKAIYDVIGPYFGKTLEQFEIDFMRDSDPQSEIAIWCCINATYHPASSHFGWQVESLIEWLGRGLVGRSYVNEKGVMVISPPFLRIRIFIQPRPIRFGQNGLSVGSAGGGRMDSRKSIVSTNSIRVTAIVKSIGFQLRSQRKHLARLVRRLTDVCDSLHCGQTNCKTPSSRCFHGQPSR